MDILNSIEWYIHASPKTAVMKETHEFITEEQLETVVFDSTVGKKVNLSLPLNDEFLFTKKKSLSTPVTVRKLLTTIYKFYREKLDAADCDKAFEDMEEWKEEIVETKYDGDCTKLIKYDVFTDTCTPDFCGLEYNENTDSFFVCIGPE